MGRMINSVAPLTMTLWAGLVLGGSLIAAPAKFQAPSLELPVALEVGRAQFLWVGYAEAACCGAMVALLVVSALRGELQRLALILALSAMLLLAVQRLALMPLLNERTDAIIAGSIVPPSQLHLVFIILEILRLAILIGASWNATQKEPSHVTL